MAAVPQPELAIELHAQLPGARSSCHQQRLQQSPMLTFSLPGFISRRYVWRQGPAQRENKCLRLRGDDLPGT